MILFWLLIKFPKKKIKFLAVEQTKIYASIIVIFLE